MLAGSRVCTLMLRRWSSLLVAWAERTGAWRRAFVAVGLFVVAFSIVGMHQLSVDHQLAAPTVADTSRVGAPAPAHGHFNPHDHETAGINAGPVSTSLDLAGLVLLQGSVPVDPSHESSEGHGKGCPGCGSHTMAFGACLLALTLLVLSWWLAPPWVRLLPPQLHARARTVISRVDRRVPALSLAELSILRT